MQKHIAITILILASSQQIYSSEIGSIDESRPLILRRQKKDQTCHRKCLVGSISLTLLALTAFIACNSLSDSCPNLPWSDPQDCSYIKIAPCGKSHATYARHICGSSIKINDPAMHARLKKIFPEALSFTSEKDDQCLKYGSKSCKSLEQALFDTDQECHSSTSRAQKSKTDHPRYIFKKHHHGPQKYLRTQFDKKPYR
jgi:hypothetical protein